MKINRRSFVKRAGAVGLLASTGLPVFSAGRKNNGITLTILHSNDVHSQIDPFPDNHARFPGRGGFARRLAYAQKVRQQDPDTLIFDCGDFFQGTPYFNFYKGKLEISLMNRMKIDAATIGNHEFDNGLEMLSERVSEAQFPMLNANYNFGHPELKKMIKPYIILERKGLRIGVFGLGVELDGLVNAVQYGDTVYNEPVKVACELSHKLKQDERCDLVIAITHIGYSMGNNQDDKTLASQSEHIDLILGGHTHTFLEKPDRITNKAGKSVWVNQAGASGVSMGHITLTVNRNKQGKAELTACNGKNEPMMA